MVQLYVANIFRDLSNKCAACIFTLAEIYLAAKWGLPRGTNCILNCCCCPSHTFSGKIRTSDEACCWNSFNKLELNASAHLYCKSETILQIYIQAASGLEFFGLFWTSFYLFFNLTTPCFFTFFCLVLLAVSAFFS